MARLREFGVVSRGNTITIADVARLRRYSQDQVPDEA